MRYSSVFVFAIAMGFASCLAPDTSEHGDQNAKEEQVDVNQLKEDKMSEIANLEEQVWKTLDADEKTKRQLLVAYKDFSRNYHDDPITPQYLFDAGRLSIELDKPRSAIKLFTDVHDGFPKFSRKIEAAYLVGLTYELQLNDRTMAKKAYAKVIEGYPDTEWAKTAQTMIDQLYMTDEQLIKMYQDMNKDQNQNETP
ncbi:MAG: tetratricopeptide repeat protein [Bacteroidota bacterium]